MDHRRSGKKEVQHMRHQYIGIMAGIGTVLADDPILGLSGRRLEKSLRIVLRQ